METDTPKNAGHLSGPQYKFKKFRRSVWTNEKPLPLTIIRLIGMLQLIIRIAEWGLGQLSEIKKGKSREL